MLIFETKNSISSYADTPYYISKDKDNRAFEYHNDSKKNYYLYPADNKIEESGLIKKRLIKNSAIKLATV